MAKKNTLRETKVVTGNVIIVFPQLFEPRAVEEGGEKKYSARLIIPKSDKRTIMRIKQARQNAIENGLERHWNGKKPKKFEVKELLDGDEFNEERVGDGEEPRPEMVDAYYLNVNSKLKPEVVKPVGKTPEGRVKFAPIEDEDEIYPGVIARASINFYCYNLTSSKGVTAGLNSVVKVMDGDFLGSGRTSASADFADEDFDIDGLDADEDEDVDLDLD